MPKHRSAPSPGGGKSRKTVQNQQDVRKKRFYDPTRRLHRVMPPVLAAVALYLLIALAGAYHGERVGFLGWGIAVLALGLFSASAFALPLLIFFHGVFWKSDIRKRRIGLRVFYSLAILSVLSAVLCVLAGTPSETPAEAFRQGLQLRGHGLVGTLLGAVLLKMTGITGLAIIGFLLLYLFCVTFGGFAFCRRMLRCLKIPRPAVLRAGQGTAIREERKETVMTKFQHQDRQSGDESFASLRAKLEQEEAQALSPRPRGVTAEDVVPDPKGEKKKQFTPRQAPFDPDIFLEITHEEMPEAAPQPVQPAPTTERRTGPALAREIFGKSSSEEFNLNVAGLSEGDFAIRELPTADREATEILRPITTSPIVQKKARSLSEVELPSEDPFVQALNARKRDQERMEAARQKALEQQRLKQEEQEAALRDAQRLAEARRKAEEEEQRLREVQAQADANKRLLEKMQEQTREQEQLLAQAREAVAQREQQLRQMGTGTTPPPAPDPEPPRENLRSPAEPARPSTAGLYNAGQVHTLSDEDEDDEDEYPVRRPPVYEDEDEDEDPDEEGEDEDEDEYEDDEEDEDEDGGEAIGGRELYANAFGAAPLGSSTIQRNYGSYYQQPRDDEIHVTKSMVHNDPVPPPPPAPQKETLPPVDYSNYQYPPLSLLDPANPQGGATDEETEANAEKLLDALESFRIHASISNISRGPRITRYELVPERGVRVKSIAGLVDDLALALSTAGLRIEAPIPGMPAIGIEVPNKKAATVSLSELLDTDEFRSADSKTTVCVGSDVTGLPVYGNIAKMPHVLIAGATGMGKSVCINAILLSLLYKARPDEVKLILVDPKKVELNVYNGIPHLLVPVVVEPQKAAGALLWAVGEMEKRFSMIEVTGVRDIKGYNAKVRQDPSIGAPMSQIVIVIDELNDLMMSARDAVEDSIMRIAQKARAAGIHLIIGTQRPSVDVITGTIKANIPSRIAFHVSSQTDSRTILDMAGADKLLNNGDMLFFPVGYPKPLRVQGAFVKDDEVERVTSFLKQYTDGKAIYDPEVMEGIEREAEKCAAQNAKKERNAPEGGSDDRDDDVFAEPQFMEALEVAVRLGEISTSKLQTKLRIGFQKATYYIERMEEMGFVGSRSGTKMRQVLINEDQLLEIKARH